MPDLSQASLSSTRQSNPSVFVLLACFLLYCFTPSSGAQVINRGISGDIEATAFLSPANVLVGQETRYTILITNGRLEEAPPIVVPEGTQIAFLQVRRENEPTLSGPQTLFHYEYSVNVDYAGTFVIPARTINVNGIDFNLPACQLHARNLADLQRTDEEKERSYFLRTYPVKREAYVGEVIPIEVNFYVSNRVGVADWGYPELSREFFASKRFERGAPSHVLIENTPYLTLTFQSIAIALRSGDLALGPVELECRLRVYAQDANGGIDRFRQPQVNNVTIVASPVPMVIKALPDENQPERFEGAVGQFSLKNQVDVQTAKVGDPIAMEIFVRGTGNLDAVTVPTFAPENAGDWKPYQLSSEIRKTFGASLNGIVYFKQIVTPLVPTEQLPALEYSFFDPVEERYQTIVSAPIPLAITGGVKPDEIEDFTPEEAAIPLVQEKREDILDLLTTTPIPASEEKSVLKSYWFWGGQAAFGTAIYSLLMIGFYRRFGSRLFKRPVQKPPTVRKLFRALQHETHSDLEFYQRAHDVCQRWLREKGREELPEPVRVAAQTIEARREALIFAGASSIPPLSSNERESLIHSLKRLLDR